MARCSRYVHAVRQGTAHARGALIMKTICVGAEYAVARSVRIFADLATCAASEKMIAIAEGAIIAMGSRANGSSPLHRPLATICARCAPEHLLNPD